MSSEIRKLQKRILELELSKNDLRKNKNRQIVKLTGINRRLRDQVAILTAQNKELHDAVTKLPFPKRKKLW